MEILVKDQTGLLTPLAVYTLPHRVMLSIKNGGGESWPRTI